MRKSPSVSDALGRTRHIVQGRQAFLCGKAAGTGILLQGLGASAAEAVALFAEQDVLWLEAPSMLAQRDGFDPGWQACLPAHWRQWTGDTDSLCHAAATRQVWYYQQNMQLFPDFWGAVWGVVQAHLLGLTGCGGTAGQGAVLLGGGVRSLLHMELARAFAGAGYAVRVPHTTEGQASWQGAAACLREARAAAGGTVCFFSVNMQGLDAEGLTFALLRACGVPVVLWFVDNPWHILSGVRHVWWKQCHLCVTDASFIAPLRAQGATKTLHLPLAAAQHMAAYRAPVAEAPADAAVVFVGRSVFPQHDKFFAAARVDEDLLAEALGLLEGDCSGTRPDFAWWAAHTGVPLWPGAAVRAAGLGAEQCAQQQRAAYLRAAQPLGLTVYGDAGWRELLPDAPCWRLRPPVDYYGSLPQIYAQAPFSLNVTSLLLPAGLTQRHFDVWAAGGFLLTNTTAGLDIFPSELVREVALASPDALAERVRRFAASPQTKEDVRRAWAACIAREHQYIHRIQRVMDWLEEK